MLAANNQAAIGDDRFERDEASQSLSLSKLQLIPGFEQVRQRKLYLKGSVLFAEGQPARGVYAVCSGRVKLYLTSAEGKTLIVKIAQPGDLLGASATLAEHAHEMTA